MWNNLLALSGICLFSMNLLSSSKSMEFPNKFTDRQTRHLRAFAPHKFTSNTTLLTVGTWKNQKNTKNENFREIITKKWRTERGEQCTHSEHLPNTNANSSIKIRQFGRKAIIEKLNSDNTRRTTRNSYKSRWMSSSNDTNVNNIRTPDRSTLYKSLENSIPIRSNMTPTDEYSTQVFNSRLLVGNGCVSSACGEIRGLKKSTLVVDVLDRQRAPRWRRKAKNFMTKVKNRTPFDNRINGNLIRGQRKVLKEKRDFNILKKIGRVRPNMYATNNAINVNFRTLTKSNSKNKKFCENFEAAFGYILPRMTQSEKYYTANRTSSPYNHAKGSKISSYFDRENFDQHRRPKRYSKTNTVTANSISTTDLKFSSIMPIIQMEINEKKFDKTEDDLTTLRWENYKNNFKKEITIDNTTVKSWRQENPSNLWSKNLVLENAAEIFEMNRSKSEKLRRLSASCHARDAQIAKKTIFILGLFALTNGSAERAVGHSEMTAASLAIKHINQMQILGCEYELQMLINNTQEDPGVALNNFFYAMYKDQHQKKIKALLGSSNAEVTHALAKITLAWDIPTISFGSSSPQLSDNKKYPMFFRTVAPDSSHNQARIAFLHFFKWNSIITICQQEDLYSWGINDLSIKLEQSNITQEKTISFSEQDFKAHLKTMPEQDSKIIVASFSEDVAPKFFCTVYDMGLYGGDYVWILPAASQNRWWNTNEHCSKQKLIKAVNGLILISSKKQLDENEYAISFMSEKEFQNLLPKLQSEFVREAYDAVWAAALSLNRTLLSCTKENIDCLNKSFHKSFQKQFVDNFQFIQFKGTSGPILFHGADRICVTNFYQIQDGELFPIAQYNPMTLKLNFSCSKCKDIIWPSGYIPVSKRTYELHIMNITPVAFYVINSFAVLGILVSLCFLVFNIYYREQKYIKLSSPYLNATTIVGCILVYLAVIFLGIDTTTMPAAFTFQSICTARVTLLSTGCSLAFGSIFAKTYRVHQIFIKSNHGILKSKVLQDSRLVPIIGVFVLIDGVIIVIWTAIDPMEHDLYNLTLEASASHPEIIHQIQVEVCKSEYKNTWLFALGIYKAIFFILGLYMAWETRNVKIPSLNDSEYIGLTVYTVLVTTVLHFTLANVTSDRITLGYVTTTSLILFTTTSSMCLLFLPKISAIYKSKDTTQKKIVSSADLKIESNTIRFVKNDDQEPYYRVHIQNFAYRKYVAFLDREIQNLHYKVYIKSNDDPDLLARRATKIYDKLPNLRKYRREKSSSLCGGIPNLFMLAVCPVVIPRASWPYAEHLDRPITEEMSFSSETKLQSFRFEETNMIDCNHRDSEDEDHEKFGGSIPSSPLKRLFDADEYQDTSSDVEEDHNHPNSILKICKAIVHSPLSDDELKTIEQTPTITITDTEIPNDDNNQQKEEIQQLEI